MTLRLAEAQQLYDGLQDELLRSALDQFFSSRMQDDLAALVRSVRQQIRDTMKEARIAGRIEAYENAMTEMQQFAKQALKEASQ